ncbi:UDP-3-O-acyl-N-acetylglucosamine deacetylase [Roseospira marina]|uniref:UDP-3-O-acyl-N-acetylglucosamine deacetylase n=1 Tax=Roseospira marina TaxID=140057 RepID=A0A5M6I9M8_9PROT|nr:UDP-3-O-acyl-N-acetylglucosamine deacetylase [Roseospira marina]KAA5604984.1 UDP-3-O-acyl-N-acetylglucosamine deacetylase [Roseospira marina]MBB4315011.1 UDP-3-O-[3-hydroxymyristoyl] N-acetylglucosamine deacetylase [Roseospira marina]MBB5088011.1 UDP-3-O-[3-hydroxymyristoyl] N-acetylglucosamine deacetylase [Roseospira marina]
MKDATLDDSTLAAAVEPAGTAPSHRAWPLAASARRTVAGPVCVQGIGLHSGATVTLTLRPAAADNGLWIRRTDITDRDPMIPARWDHVVDTRLCTALGNAAGVTVSTVEHLMAALAALGVDNAEILVDGPELPVMDGSSAAFVAEIEAVGTVAQAAPRHAIRLVDTVSVTEGDSTVSLRPAPRGLTIDAEIDFENPVIGRQRRVVLVSARSFREELADARTFGFRHEVDGLRAMGLARGGSLDNAVVVDGDTILNPEGLRYADEFVRHKALDALGDLYLAGHPLIGVYQGLRPSHRINNLLLRALFDQPEAWRFEPALLSGGYGAGRGRFDPASDRRRA